MDRLNVHPVWINIFLIYFTMNPLTKTANELTLARDEVDKLKELLDVAKEKRDEKQFDLIKQMTKEGFKSIKTEHHNFAVVKKKDIKIVDQEAVLKALDERGLKSDLMVSKLDTIRFKSTANAMLKETGEVFEGTEVTETNYVSIKKQS